MLRGRTSLPEGWDLDYIYNTKWLSLKSCTYNQLQTDSSVCIYIVMYLFAIYVIVVIIKKRLWIRIRLKQGMEGIKEEKEMGKWQKYILKQREKASFLKVEWILFNIFKCWLSIKQSDILWAS